MKLEELEMHDALLRNASFDFIAKNVKLELDVFCKETDTKRTAIFIYFHGVESQSQIIDFNLLQQNNFAGTINYWIPNENGATTYIYLSDGLIAIKASSIELQKANPS